MMTLVTVVVVMIVVLLLETPVIKSVWDVIGNPKEVQLWPVKQGMRFTHLTV